MFPRREMSQWIELLDVSGEEAEREAMEEPPTHNSQQLFAELMIKKEEEIEANWREVVVFDDQKQEPNAWLGRTGWASHLSGLDREELIAAAQPPTEEESVLQEMCHNLETAMDAAKEVCKRRVVGIFALFEINCRESGTKSTKPFDARMESDSWLRYK